MSGHPYYIPGFLPLANIGGYGSMLPVAMPPRYGYVDIPAPRDGSLLITGRGSSGGFTGVQNIIVRNRDGTESVVKSYVDIKRS